MTALAWRTIEPNVESYVELRKAAGDWTQPTPVDPYLVWALRTRFVGVPSDVRLPFMVEVNSTISAEQRLLYRQTLSPAMNLASPPRFDTGFVEHGSIHSLATLASQGAVARFLLALARGTAPPPQTIGKLEPGPNVVLHTLGVIDDGCCLAHRRHWSADATGCTSRFLMVWDQRKTFASSAPWNRYDSGNGQDLVNYGEELSGDKLEELLATWQGEAHRGDETSFYREAIHRPNWTRADRSHGAGVIHLLAGDQPFDPAQSKPIIFVQLPQPTVQDAAGGSLGMHVLDGVRYIVQRTREFAGPQGDWKTTINISLGSIAGPHDGTTMTEMALDELVASHRTATGADRVQIVMAAGNTGGRRIHAQGEVSANQHQVFSVMVPPAQRDESYVEFWFKSDALDHISLTVRPPHGPGSMAMTIGSAGELVTPQGKVVASLIAPRRVAQGNNGSMALLALRGTASTDDVASAPYGVWEIEVHSSASAPATTVHAWVERNETIIGRRYGQRTHFIANNIVTIGDTHTLSSIAHGVSVHVVGAYTRSSKTQTADCARGPVIGREQPWKPDVMAPSNESQWLRGVRVPGFFSGSTTRLSGTSAAAPYYARLLADGDVSTQQQPSFEVQTPDGPLPGVA